MEWLQQHAIHHPQRLCINDYTYGEVYERVISTAHRLQSLLGNTKRIAILSDNSVPMAIHMLAAMLVHKEILLLNVHLKSNEIENQLHQLGINIVLCSMERSAQLPVSVRVVPFVDDTHLSVTDDVQLFIDRDATMQVGDDGNISMAAAETRKTIEDVFNWQFEDDHIAAIMNTSATTGQFKSVPLRWGQIKAHVVASQEVLGTTDDDNWLMVLPLFHVSGLSILMRSLYNGTAMTIMSSYDENKVLALIEDRRINMMSLVPTILQRLEPRITDHQLRVILLGGEFIPRPLVDACVAKALPIYKTYGMTETFSQSVTMPVLTNLDKIDSVGKPLPGMEVHIVNPDKDGVGEIHLSGPMVMSGYIGKNPIAGDFNTDDIGYIDDDGYVYILNRRTDLIISGGENIYPKEIEDLLYAHHLVKECVVVAAPDERWGQVPVLFVSCHNGESGSSYNGENENFHNGKTENSHNCKIEDSHNSKIEDSHNIECVDSVAKILQDYMLCHLAKYKVPKVIRILDALPRNGTGKIMRKALQQQAEAYVNRKGL